MMPSLPRALAWFRPLLLVPLLAGGVLAAESSAPDPLDPKAALAFSQAALGRALEGYRLADSRGRSLDLAQFRGKPLVVNLVFTACTTSCPLIVQTLARAVEMAQSALGADSFAVVTVGFDTRNDTPERMRAYARNQGVDLPNWYFLSGDAATLARLTADLGFLYFPSPRGFDHLAQVSVLDTEGRVFQQVYGDNFAPPALVEPLKSLRLGQAAPLGIAGMIERVRLFCTLYDPTTQRYQFDYSIFISLVVGGLSLLGLAGIVLRAVLRARRLRPLRTEGG